MQKRGGARPGAGRKAREPGDKRKRLSTTVSGLSWHRLRALASRSGMSVSEVLDQLIELAAAHPAVVGLLAEAGLLEGDEAGDATARPVPCAPSAGDEPELRRVGKPLVLVVEDDAASLELLRLRLEFMGCEVCATDKVEEAFRLAETLIPSLVIADLILFEDPEAGLTLIRRLRAANKTARIPIAIHSVHVREETELPDPLPKVEALLPKPFKVKQLADLVANYCSVTARDTTVFII